MATELRLDFARVRMLAFAGAASGAAIALAVAWTFFVHDVEPALAVLALPALVGPILHPRSTSGLFVSYMLFGMIASTITLLLGMFI